MLKIIAIVFLCLISACAPRGEYKSVDTLLTLAKERYAKVATVETPAKAELTPLTEKLELVVTDHTIATDIAKSLRKLIKQAGYTSRPAMNELVLQYESVANNSGKLVNDASLKLLTSRTFNLLATELQSTAFRIS